jgi:hypothetical protein
MNGKTKNVSSGQHKNAVQTELHATVSFKHFLSEFGLSGERTPEKAFHCVHGGGSQRHLDFQRHDECLLP